MRIIAGEFRGRKISRPEGADIRPTKDRVREAVFNMIAADVPGSRTLDLFAGSGAYGLEALSRGAAEAVFVDNSGPCVSVMEGNIRLLGVGDRSHIIRRDVEPALEDMGGDKEKFDLIFADPPYKMGLAKKTLIMINHYDILSTPGLLIMEHHVSESVPDAEGDVSVCKQKTYGDISISVFIRK